MSSEIRFSPARLSTATTSNSSLCFTSEGVVTAPLLAAEEVTELNNNSGGLAVENQLEGLGPKTETSPATSTRGSMNRKSLVDEDGPEPHVTEVPIEAVS